MQEDWVEVRDAHQSVKNASGRFHLAFRGIHHEEALAAFDPEHRPRSFSMDRDRRIMA